MRHIFGWPKLVEIYMCPNYLLEGVTYDSEAFELNPYHSKSGYIMFQKQRRSISAGF